MSKKKPVLEVSLVMSGFHTVLPMAVIKPKGLTNQRLLINIAGWQPGYSKAEMRLAVSPLTRRYGKLEDILHTKDFVKLTHERSVAPNIEKDQKVKVSYTSFNFLMTSGGKRFFVTPMSEAMDTLAFGYGVGNHLVGELKLPKPVVETIANFVEGK